MTTETTNPVLATLLARAIEQASRPAKTRTKTPKVCSCGCGAMTRGGNWLPGHDAKAYSRLLAEARAKAAA